VLPGGKVISVMTLTASQQENLVNVACVAIILITFAIYNYLTEK
jgi:hypothetical protein